MSKTLAMLSEVPYGRPMTGHGMVGDVVNDLLAVGRRGHHQDLARLAQEERSSGNWNAVRALELALAWLLAGDLRQADLALLEADQCDPFLRLVPDVWGLWPLSDGALPKITAERRQAMELAAAEQRHTAEAKALQQQHAAQVSAAVAAAEENCRKMAAMEQALAVAAAVEQERASCKSKAMDDLALMRTEAEVRGV